MVLAQALTPQASHRSVFFAIHEMAAPTSVTTAPTNMAARKPLAQAAALAALPSPPNQVVC